MKNGGRSVFRGWHNKTSLSVKIIIALLVLIILTLTALLFKDRIARLFEPDVTYPDTDLVAPSESREHGADPSATEAVKAEMTIKPLGAAAFESDRGPLIVVNQSNGYNFKDADKDQLIELYSADHKSFTLASISEALLPEAYASLYKMTEKYADMYGYCPVMITSSYRDYAAQEEYYNSRVTSDDKKDYVESPGFSDHHTGYAFDIKLYDKDGKSYSYVTNQDMVEWIVDHYKDYGFIIRYPANKKAVTGIDGEGNHFRYVGVPHSVYMTDKRMCLEEYVAMIKKYGRDEPFEYEYNGVTYLIWYCDGKDGYVYVPSDREYTLSGDNLGGFIVTTVK